MQAEKGLHAI